LTISARLGEGVFFLHPVRREALGLAALTYGGAYAIQRVDRKGNLHTTGLQAITAELPSISEGILVYSARRLIMAEVKITARRPRDTAELTQRVIQILDDVGVTFSSGSSVWAILSHLEPAALTTAEMMDILNRLKRAGRVGEFLRLVAIKTFRDFLKGKE